MKVIAALILSLGIGLLISLLMAIPLMLAWNYVIPYLFHLPEIGVLQAFCLSFVSSTLLGKTIHTS